MSFYGKYPATGGVAGNTIVEYANFAAFPSAVTAGNGAFAFALDTQILYESNGTSWTAIAGPGNVLSIGSPANGLAITANVLTIALASTSTTGALSNTDWNTFNSKGSGTVTAVSVATANGFAGSSSGGATPALTLSTTITGILQGNGTAISAATTGNLTDAGTDGITVTSGTGAVLGSGTSIAQRVADSTHNGYLSSTDWNTFNGKQASGNYITALTGDVTASGPGSVAATVAKIQGTTVSGTTGSTNVVFSSAPTLSNPIVGTQSQGDSSTKAASTSYVDVAIANAIAGVNPAVAVQAATTAAANTSSYTYSNGASGIGATLTGPNNTALTVDGFTFTLVNQRILVKDDTQSPSGAFNGVYYVSALQTAITGVILIRALDFDTPSDMNNTGSIPVVNGTVNGTTSWVLTSLITTVGTSPATFTKFTRNPADYLLVANNLSDVAVKATSFNNLSPMTTSGDIIYGGASGAGTRLAANATATNKYLQSVNSGIPAYAQVAFSDLSGSVAAAQMPALTGDVTTSAGAVATTLATVNSNVGSFGSATQVGTFTVNAKGLITAASNTTITVPVSKFQIFTANGTFTTPASVTATTVVKITCVGSGAGGGSGGAGSGGAGGGGGGGGGTAIGWVTGTSLGVSKTVTVGAAGTAGGNGNASSVGTLVVAGGGSAGGNGTGTGTPGAPGAAGAGTTGDIIFSGGTGGIGTAGVAGTINGSGGIGGSSFMGGGGSGAGSGVGGIAGQNYGGGGGGGGGSSGAGLAGAAGVVMFEWFG